MKGSVKALFGKAMFGKGMGSSIAACALLFAMSSEAAVVLPQMEVLTLAGDAGAVSSGSAAGSSLTFGATSPVILTTSGVFDIPDTAFSLTTTRINATTFGPGTLSVGTLLQASFTSLTLTSLPVGASFFANLTFTGGTYGPVGGSGRIEGALGAATITAPINMAGAFLAPNIAAKIGPVINPVVPIPAAVWLFGSACSVLLMQTRRRAAPLAA